MSKFKDEAEKREAEKLSHKPFYLYKKNKDGSWEVRKCTGNVDTDKEYEITALGSCSCKGYKYNDSCKHSETVMEEEFWPHSTTKEKAETMVERVKKVYSFDMKFKGFKKNDDEEFCEAVFQLESEKLKDQYDELLVKPEGGDLLIRFEL